MKKNLCFLAAVILCVPTIFVVAKPIDFLKKNGIWMAGATAGICLHHILEKQVKSITTRNQKLFLDNIKKLEGMTNQLFARIENVFYCDCDIKRLSILQTRYVAMSDFVLLAGVAFAAFGIAKLIYEKKTENQQI